jgi:4a-hydroxytetrahydrobiopterin dehydratase
MWSDRPSVEAVDDIKGNGMSALRQEDCVPCQGGVPALDLDEVGMLLSEVPDWSLAEDPPRIERSWTFTDFQTALDFVVQAGAVAEAAGHHPDISLGWGYVDLSLHTHAIGGLQRADFVLAAKIDDIPLPKGAS